MKSRTSTVAGATRSSLDQTDTTRPRVSVIIPTHNRALMLIRAVDSVLAQTFADFELLIVDDGSTDETSEVVAGFADPRIRSFRHVSNRGQAAARNTGIANAQGEYIAFLDDDDEFLPTKIEEQVEMLDAAGDEVGMVYVWCSYVGPTGEMIGTRCRVAEGYVFDQALMLGLKLGIGSTSMTRASVFDVVGMFDEALLRCADLELMCRLARRYELVLIPKILTRLHMGHTRLSAPSKKSMTEWRDHILTHLAMFHDDIKGRRKIRAYLWRLLARAELQINKYGGAIRAVAVAFAIDPGTAKAVGNWLVRGLITKFRRSVGERRVHIPSGPDSSANNG